MFRGVQPQVLCVDDDLDSLDLLARILRRAGYGVTLASTITAGRDLLKEEKFDVVITDYELADGTGMDMVRAARKDGTLRGTPVMLWSGREDPPRERVAFFRKPMADAADFLARVRALLYVR